MGCAFDSFSTSWGDRSYVVVLLVIGWLIPLINVCISYYSIMFRVRNSLYRQLTRPKQNERPNGRRSTVSRAEDGVRLPGVTLDKTASERVSSRFSKLQY